MDVDFWILMVLQGLHGSPEDLLATGAMVTVLGKDKIIIASLRILTS